MRNVGRSVVHPLEYASYISYPFFFPPFRDLCINRRLPHLLTIYLTLLISYIDDMVSIDDTVIMSQYSDNVLTKSFVLSDSRYAQFGSQLLIFKGSRTRK